MNNFEIDKMEYLEKISKNINIVNSLIDKNNAESLKFAKVLLNPKNEKELMVASSTIGFVEDIKGLIEAASLGNVKEIPVEENEGLKTLAILMKKIYNDEEVNIDALLSDNEVGKASPKKVANFLFSSYVALLGDSEKCFDYIIGELNMSNDSEIDMYKFKLALAELQTKMNEIQATNVNNDIDKMSDENVGKLVEFTDEFHNLCDKYIKKEVQFSR